MSPDLPAACIASPQKLETGLLNQLNLTAAGDIARQRRQAA
jgi:hypothetical protein